MRGPADIYSALNWGKSVVEHPMSAGDHTGWAMAGTAADYVALMQGVADAGARMNSSLAGTYATPIIRAGLLTMMGMSNACGVGGPEKGDRFANGAEGFKAASQTLESTKPPMSWEGDASNAYADRNEEQKHRAEAMAEVDHTVKEILDNEAHQVDVARKMLDRCQTTLTLTIPIAVALKTIPVKGAALALAAEITAVAGTVHPATHRFQELVRGAARNATEIRRAGASYDAIASGAQPS